MPIPASLQPGLRPVTLGSHGNPLALSIQKQENGKWCWAAVAASVAGLLRPRPQGWRQCDIAANCLPNAADCCQRPAAYNQELELPPALDFVGCFGGNTAPNLQMSDIQREIDAGRPVCVRVEFPAGSSVQVKAHFLVIYGYDVDHKVIDVADPADQSAGPQSLVNFPSLYHGATWTDSYLT
jgi:hypothetical protein